jgi:hypothetical protein
VSERPDPRRATEEASRTGRFPGPDGTVEDDSNPIEPEIPESEVDDDDVMRPNEAVPLSADLPGVVVTSPAQQHPETNAAQGGGEFDRGVATEHLRSPSQGARPDSE